ncbi:MAG: allose kinase [Tenericutes bacterium HGW-Tenericutes-5]|nr:MAG: allose kinase [Tenericutes bacterium HGW-Tenericutes-5]
MTRVLGIDIGGTHTRYGVIENDKLISVEKLPTNSIEDFSEFIKELLKTFNNIDKTVIGVPGIVYQNEIINIPNVANLNVKNLASIIENKTKVKTIIKRDVQLLFNYDVNQLGLDHEPGILAFYLGTGIGNFIKVNNEILEGTHGFASELGHVPVAGNTKVCPCGKIGCAETIISGKALVQLYEEENLSGDFLDVFVNHQNHPKIINFIVGFSELIAFEMNIFDITKLIIGGGVINMKGFPKATLKKLIEKHLRSVSLLKDLSIYFVEDTPQKSILGAALIAKGDCK